VSDLGAVALALSTAAGALAARPVPPPVALALVAVAFVRRSPPLLCLGALLLASSMSARAWAGLRPPAAREWAGVVTLVGDPEDAYGALRVDVRVGRRRMEAWARGEAAGRLRDRLTGERVSLTGRIAPLSDDARRRLAVRHVSARLDVDRVGRWAPGDPLSRLANGLRRTLLAGVASLPSDRRGLFAGFVLGDNREQGAETVDDFRASGLAHLLVVSGQNVAFVLALAAPLLRRLPIGGRAAGGAFVLVGFGFVTRWEPSVLRAEAMAAITLLAGTLARPVSGVRVLALAISALLLVDPILVRSVSFLLSVGACAGIARFAAPIASALPGPRPLASALGVTLAAQLGVAPVLVPVFGGLPVAALPANLLAVPAAGPVMMWGLAAGLPAGLLGGTVARVAHLPTGALIAWVARVARLSARMPLGELRLLHVALLATAAAFVTAPRRGLRTVAALVAVATLIAPALEAQRPRPAWAQSIATGATLWQLDGATVLQLDRSLPPDLLASLRRWRVRRVDVLVLGRPSAAGAGAAVARRVRVRRVLAGAGDEAGAGALRVEVAADHSAAGGKLLTRVTRRSSE
jgi:competence protein ComEC